LTGGQQKSDSAIDSKSNSGHTTISFPATPASISGGSTPLIHSSPEATLAAISSSLRPQTNGPATGSWTEPDGAIVHTIAVSQGCFKVGRITVPPALVFAVSGFAAPPLPSSFHAPSPSDLSTHIQSSFGANTTSYSHHNPPPHFSSHVKPLMSPLHGGSVEKLRAFMSGGWKEVPEGERWWEQAMGVGAADENRSGFKATEERRVRGLEVVGRLPEGLAGLRGL